MESLDELICELQDEEVAAPVQTPEPTIRWTKRDIDGNIIYSRPRSSRNQSNQARPCRRIDPPLDAPDTSHELAFAPETVECFLRDLQHSLSDTSEDDQDASA
ncbi:hypothetical protein JOQ06_013785 [Pogonophryne albipinna]|uniref:Ig-like domain-containing protein n=1 Tax=Pogonophryne albipinna TaxID=1090488 RepID=A0AAD6BJI9_9TELE|nr:hypothetical protein JOQ06_013785 [Pogonophryne albipinna]